MLGIKFFNQVPSFVFQLVQYHQQTFAKTAKQPMTQTKDLIEIFVHFIK